MNDSQKVGRFNHLTQAASNHITRTGKSTLSSQPLCSPRRAIDIDTGIGKERSCTATRNILLPLLPAEISAHRKLKSCVKQALHTLSGYNRSPCALPQRRRPLSPHPAPAGIRRTTGPATPSARVSTQAGAPRATSARGSSIYRRGRPSQAVCSTFCQWLCDCPSARGWKCGEPMF
jgi:hypothetical protein